MVHFAVISLTTPVMLWGLALLSLPIIAHLMNRRVKRRVVFPTIRLLQESAATQARLFRIRRLLLLLLRCLAVALIAWAFARPVWSEADAPGEANAGVGAVIVVDASLSTGYRVGGVPVASSIRAAAQRALDGLHAGVDSADVVFATAQPEAVFERVVPNLPALRDAVERMVPTHERADLEEAIGLAGRILADHEGPRQLVVVSDLQFSGWVEVMERGSLGELLPAGATVTIADVAAPAGRNVAPSAPRLYPLLPLVGQPAQAIATIINHADDPASVEVALTLDGQPAGTRRLALRPREEREVAFELELADERDHEVTFRVDPDDLAADDAVHLVARAVNRIPIVVIGDDDPEEPGTSTYFVERALAPYGGEADQYRVRQVHSRAVAPAVLAPAAAVFIGDIATLSPVAAATLVAYMEGGGGVAYLLGDGPVVENLERLEAVHDDVALLPWHPGPVRAGLVDDAASRIVTGAWRSRLLRTFDQRAQLALSRIHFERSWTARDVRPETTVLLAFGDGTPALAVRPVGDGRLVLANFSPSRRGGDLGKHGAFVALAHSLAQHLQPERGATAPTFAGEPGVIRSRLGEASGGALAVVGAAGAPDHRVVTEVDGDAVVASLPRPETPGFYRLVRGAETIGRLAVNVDPRESELRRMEAASVLAVLGTPSASVRVAGLAESGAIIRPHGRPLWSWLVVAALVALALELTVLSVWSR